MKRAITYLTLLAGALLLAACTIQVNTTLEAGGAGELRTEMGFDQADQQALATIGTKVEDFCAETQSKDLGVDVPVTVEERGDELWCVATLPFEDLAALREIYGGMGGVKVNALEISGGQVVYDVDIAFVEDETQTLGVVNLTYNWQVTLPGAINEHNADDADGNTLTWRVALGETVNAHATSTVGGLSGLGGGAGPGGLGRTEYLFLAVVLLCCCGLLVVVLAVAVYVLMQRRKAAGP